MKKYIVYFLLHMNIAIVAMNNNDPRPIKFDSPSILFHRLYMHDKKHNTAYSLMSDKFRLHQQLGNSIQSRSEANTKIKVCLKNYHPNMPESLLIEHKRNIINILRPELGLQPPKL